MQKTKFYATLSLILGIIGIFFGILFAIPSLVFGVITLKRIKDNPTYQGKILAIIGIILSGLVVIRFGLLVFNFFYIPMYLTNYVCDNNFNVVGINCPESSDKGVISAKNLTLSQEDFESINFNIIEYGGPVDNIFNIPNTESVAQISASTVKKKYRNFINTVLIFSSNEYAKTHYNKIDQNNVFYKYNHTNINCSKYGETCYIVQGIKGVNNSIVYAYALNFIHGKIYVSIYFVDAIESDYDTIVKLADITLDKINNNILAQ